MQHPVLAVYGAWIRVLTGRPDDAERLLALADGATSTGPLPDGSATIEPWIATLRAHMMRDGVERALADADLALDQLPPGSWWIPGALRMRGVAHGLLGATDRETEDLKRIHRGGAGPGRPGRRRPAGSGTARAPRGQAKRLGRGRRTRTGGTGDRRREGSR